MKNGFRSIVRYSLIACVLLLAMPAFAEDAPAPQISAQLYKQLTVAEKLISQQSYVAARQKLQKILAGVKAESYEQALVLRSLASVYALENNYAKAAQFLQQCTAMQQLPAKQQQAALLNLGQLYMATEQYRQAIKILTTWLAKSEGGHQQVLVLLANAHAQLKQYRQALPYIERAIKQAKKPKEGWLQLNLALHYELENYTAAAGILKKLVRLFPDKKDYWQQLASIYQQLRKYAKALAITHLAYEKGFIQSETQILALFNLFLYQKQPYQAANLLLQEINAGRVKRTAANWERLANAWTSAREYKQAIKALEQASLLHEKGDLYLQLGRIHVEQELWEAAIKAINKALRKGKLSRTGEAYILLGMSLYETGQIAAAKKAFQTARKYRKTKKSAEQWLNYIEQS